MSRQRGELHTILGRCLGSPLRLRRLLVRRQYERRRRWVEQVGRTPTMRQLHEAGRPRRAGD